MAENLMSPSDLPSLDAQMQKEGPAWLILENESGLFWRPNSNGYTRHLHEAGIYPEWYAKKIASNPSRHDLAVPLSHYVEGIERLHAALTVGAEPPQQEKPR